ncbi:MAG: GNAT family N-acetyltransferase [Phycisphaerales bacterium]
MSVIYYEGERIYFRPVEPEDEPLLRRWINDPRVWSTLGHRLPINAVREREFIDNCGKDDKNIIFGVVVRDGEQLIGTCGLHGIHAVNRNATYGLVIGDVEQHGCGYGTETTKLALKFAFEELNLHRVELTVFDFNQRAIRAYEKAGFVREGCHRQAFYRHGQFHDVLRYGVLHEDWIKQPETNGRREAPIEVTT